MQMIHGKPGRDGAMVMQRSEIARCLDMETCIEIMRGLNAGLGAPHGAGHQVTFPVRSVFPLPRRAPAPKFFGSMPAHARFATGQELFGAKCLSVFPGNPRANGLESHQGVFVLFDGEDGRLLGLFDAGEITAQRTAANSAIAARYLLPTGCDISEAAETPLAGISVALVGTGIQARRHALAFATAMRRTRRPVRSIRICPRDCHSAAAASCRRDIVQLLQEAKFEACLEQADSTASEAVVVEVQTLTQAAMDSDIICTVTSAKAPILTHRDHLAKRVTEKPVLIIAVGACTPDTRELGGDVIAAAGADIWVDNREAAGREAGDLLLAAGESCLARAPADLEELTEVVARPTRHNRSVRGQVAVFKSLGNGAQDLAVAKHLYDAAQEQDATCIRFDG